MAEAATLSPSTSALLRRALSLGSVNAISFAVQFLLPVILARFLVPDDFGQYRLIWLAIMTAMCFVPMEMPGVLYYFLPRSNADEQRLYIHQTCVYLAVAGAVAALAVSSFNPWLPDNIRRLGPNAVFLPGLVFLYAATLLLDTLPTIEERIRWQAAATLSLALLRALLLTGAAWLTGDLQLLLWLLVATLMIKAVILFVYIGRHHGLGGAWFGWREFCKQVIHAAPFGFADTLYQLRAQAAMWVVASLFTLGQFAAFSIAAMIAPLVNLCRQSVNHIFLPSMSRLHAADDIEGTIRLNNYANAMVSLLAYPMLAFVFVFAEEIIRLVFTAGYLEAAAPMRISALGLVVLLVEVSSLTLLQGDGNFVLRINTWLLAVAVGLSWLAARQFGLFGAALGGIVALVIDRAITLRRIACHTGIPIRRLQDWAKLGRLLGAVCIAAAIAGTVGERLPEGAVFIRLLVGGLTLVGFYGVFLYLTGDLPKRGGSRL